MSLKNLLYWVFSFFKKEVMVKEIKLSTWVKPKNSFVFKGEDNRKSYIAILPDSLKEKLPSGNGLFKDGQLVESVYSGPDKVQKISMHDKIFYVMRGDGEFYWSADFYDANGLLLNWALDKYNGVGKIIFDKKK